MHRTISVHRPCPGSAPYECRAMKQWPSAFDGHRSVDVMRLQTGHGHTQAVPALVVAQRKVHLMPLGDTRHDREPEAAALALRFLAAIATVEDPFEFGLRNARAGIDDLEANARTGTLQDHVDTAAARRMPDRIVDQIAEQHAHAVRLRQHGISIALRARALA